MAANDGRPTDPNTDEATPAQLELARAQVIADGRALEHMTDEVADGGGEQRSGHSLIGSVVEQAEGMDEWVDGGLVWREPGEATLHVEVVVRDAGDGRFVPGARVEVAPIDPHGNPVGIHDHPLIGHPMLYHYGRNWAVPMDGDDTLRVRVAPPTFMRHDEINDHGFLEPTEVEFRPVKVTRGQG